ncbi:MAG: hypothetical protein HC865_14695 [Cyanobacteria bacterium RU_5_0]|nr:hypothetical protein [Cyanobacteria bacterium RU_5_0]
MEERYRQKVRTYIKNGQITARTRAILQKELIECGLSKERARAIEVEETYRWEVQRYRRDGQTPDRDILESIRNTFSVLKSRAQRIEEEVIKAEKSYRQEARKYIRNGQVLATGQDALQEARVIRGLFQERAQEIEAEELYRQEVRKYISDGQISETEQDKLEPVQNDLGLSETRVREIETEELYRRKVERFIRNGQVSEAKRVEIERIRINLRLSLENAQEIEAEVIEAETIYRREVRNYLKDGQVLAMGRTILQNIRISRGVSSWKTQKIETEEIYRQDVQKYIRNRLIFATGQFILDDKRKKLNLLEQDANEIELEELKAYNDRVFPQWDEYQQRWQKYDRIRATTIRQEKRSNLSSRAKQELETVLAIIQADEIQFHPEEKDWLEEKSWIRDKAWLEEGAEFPRLQRLLEAEDWEEANRETFSKLLEIAGRQEQGYLTARDIEFLPIATLRRIDDLWDKNSGGHFGFTAQRKVWEMVDKDIQIFSDRVGWYKNNSWVSDDLIIFSLTIAPKGHLPVVPHRGWWCFTGGIRAIIQKLTSYSI